MNLVSNGNYRKYTKFQLFVLTYLASEEANQRLKEQAIDSSSIATHHSQGSVIPEPISVTINELSDITPPDFVPGSEDFMKEIEVQIATLEHDGLIEISNRYYGEWAKINATSKGRFFIRRELAKILKHISPVDGKFDSVTDRTPGVSSPLKKFFRDSFLPKVKEKAIDEAIDMLFQQVKITGPALLVLAINYLFQK